MLADVTMAQYRAADGVNIHFYRQFPMMLSGDIGINSDGLTIGQTSLHPGLLPISWDGVPHTLLPPHLLETCRNVEDVRRRVASIKLMAPKGYTVNVADATGHTASFDCTNHGCAEVPPVKEVNIATNHLRHPPFVAIDSDHKNAPVFPGYLTNSQRRYDLLSRLRDEAPNADRDWWEHRLLHSDATDTLIQPGTEECERLITIWLAILDPANRSWSVTRGLPRRWDFQTFTIQP